MAKHFFHGKRRGTLVALSAALCATLALGMLAACDRTDNSGTDSGDDDETVQSTATDTQLLRNGNFEFYSERDTKVEDKRAFIASPTSWSFTSGSPSSITASGIINTEEWSSQLTKSTFRLVRNESAEEEIGTNESASSFTAKELSEDDASYAEAHWEEASVYDRLLFYKYYGIDSAEEFSLYDDYKYSIDYEDIQYLKSDFGGEAVSLRNGADPEENSVLMIHNKRISDHVLGTAQYYTSSTTITLEAGSSAEVSVWVRTDKLYHWFDAENTVGDKQEIQSQGGAYIGVINTVGGTTLPEMQIKNIRTGGEWEKYTIYIRANTYATSTFRLKLGLGQGSSSDNRFEHVDGYAFFDDVTVTKKKSAAYDTDTQAIDQGYTCNINSDSDEKIFNRDEEKGYTSNKYALDLLSDSFDDLTQADLTKDFDIGLTSEKVSENKTYYSFIKDNRADGKVGEKTETPAAADKQSIVGFKTYAELEADAAVNGYLKNIFDKDFEKFPFETETEMPILMLLSTNGAAYTATVKNGSESEDGLFTLKPNTRKLLSFFVKTSTIPSGRQGAGITLIDGEEKTSISPFDSTTVNPVTIDSTKEELTDIYDGWVQCFFIVSNETDTPKTFYLNFTYGTTSVQGTDATDYSDGYAAFTNFRMMDLTKTQYSYASTGTYAQKVSLTSYAEDTSKFDSAEASSNIKKELAAPSSFIGAVAGSSIFETDGQTNAKPAGVEAGLLRKEYAAEYMNTATGEAAPAWAAMLNGIATGATNAQEWWGKLFGENDGTSPREANQPLLIMNTNSEATASYGFFNRTMETTISASTSQRISLRVKVQADTTAYIYLLDTSEASKGKDTMLAPSVPKYTYWYDDDGNILRCDPESDAFDEDNDILFYLEANGLYVAAEDYGKDGAKTYYANLANYTEAEHADGEKGDLLTSTGLTAFYYNKADGKYYGYREETSENEYQFTQPVEQLPTTVKVDGKDVSILHYNDPMNGNAKMYESVIAVKGSALTESTWVDVNFYVRTGSVAKTYRIEVWAGDRSNSKDGFPGGGYVFFDAFSSGSISNFETLRDGDESGTGAKDLLLENDANKLDTDPEKLNTNLALYYTFTFYDSAAYLRHDREHEEVDYNKWENYTQSTYSEGTVWLKCFDPDGTLYGADADHPANPSYSIYLDFTPLDVSVTAYEPDEDVDEEEEPEEEETTSETNIWLVLSSSVLAFVTIFAVVAVIVRMLRKKHKSSAPANKPKKEKKVKPTPAAPAAPAEEPAPESKDNDDPYND